MNGNFKKRIRFFTMLTMIVWGISPGKGLFAQVGDLDANFSDDGKVTTDINGSTDEANAVVIQSDGKIIVAGRDGSGAGNGDFALARYNNDGTLDAGFGSGGKVSFDISGGFDVAESVALQTDGKIVVAGNDGAGAGGGDFALARLNSDGTLDTGFGVNGIVSTDFNSVSDEADAVALQTDGKIVVAGRSGGDFALARYNSDGALDAGFGSGGKVTTDILSSFNSASAMAIQSDGKIVVAGRVGSGPGGSDFALARYNSDGTLDSGFGSGGIVTTDINIGFDEARALGIQFDGKIIVGGRDGSGAGGGDFALVRYNSDGTLDSGFGSGGKATADVDNTVNMVFSLALQLDGKILATGLNGSGEESVNAIGDFTLVRFNFDGTLDTGFGVNGIVSTDFNSSFDQANAVALQVNGKIVAAGRSGNDFALARYLNSVSTPPADTDSPVATTNSFTDDPLSLDMSFSDAGQVASVEVVEITNMTFSIDGNDFSHTGVYTTGLPAASVAILAEATGANARVVYKVTDGNGNVKMNVLDDR